jgi:hypothetical protein
MLQVQDLKRSYGERTLGQVVDDALAEVRSAEADVQRAAEAMAANPNGQ